ncbi:auxin-responsive protein SAUR19 [Alnus glutinosa]|uniref:auxin-responsive protein SAUR19 n=1 Tax=Alnus glutinosa TaxID=3517 RepID=UPI002D7696FE|nr:auxin-responsive protein SAUR19 [Alnus glutinosa]
MLGSKMVPFKKLAKKVKVVKGSTGVDHNKEPSHRECLLKGFGEAASLSSTTPVGFFALYVGEERQRFVVPTGFLSHPLIKMLLEKSYNEFGFEQNSGLVVPCSVSTFQEVLNAVEGSNGKFDFGKLVEEFV